MGAFAANCNPRPADDPIVIPDLIRIHYLSSHAIYSRDGPFPYSRRNSPVGTALPLQLGLIRILQCLINTLGKAFHIWNE
jgi:hypothetical protein